MVPQRLPPRSRSSHTKRWLMLALLVTSFASVAVLNYRGMFTSAYFNRIDEQRNKLRSSKVVDELVTLLLAKQESKDHVHNNDNNTLSTTTPMSAPQPTPRNVYQGDEDRSELHIVFSMSCDQGRRVPLQTILQYSAVAVGQRGPITQILSGCTDSQREEVMREPTLYYDFRRHFTPSYSPHPTPNVTDYYTPYNKPFALRHFLRNAQPPVKHDIIALIDGDMVFFKPLEVNTGRNMTKYYHGKRHLSTVNDTVADGVAIAQDWYNYLNIGWYADAYRAKLEAICTGKPCMNVTRNDAREYYSSTGPPYIMTRHDMELMVDDYCDFVVQGRRVDDAWMVEMFAAVVMPSDPPVGIHYCQKYGFVEGDHKGHYYYKYDLPETLVNCDSPLLKVPPASDWDTLEQTTPRELLVQKRHEVWIECSTTKVVNQAMIKYKQRSCSNGYSTEQSIEMVKL
ncbi:bZIP transcription factor 1 [Phytophthora nicotianae]|uniref:BZIP transcription factor 1 n=1 Tax=Phytophthora nicotianae TaxID=4792 RepID=A0A0W8CF14_PHYNI|nr:bZIP transcription factor 1 [Phytophthora nicotianae]